MKNHIDNIFETLTPSNEQKGKIRQSIVSEMELTSKLHSLKATGLSKKKRRNVCNGRWGGYPT